MDALTFFYAFNKLPQILFPIRPAHNPIPMHFAIKKIALIFSTMGLYKFSISTKQVIFKFTRIFASVFLKKDTIPIFYVLAEIAFVFYKAIYLYAVTFFYSVVKLALIIIIFRIS